MREKRMGRIWCAALVTAALCFGADVAWSQSKPEFIPFQGTTKGVLYRPDAGPAPHVGILVMHRTANYLTHRASRNCPSAASCFCA
jgi:hypothetical protein